MPRYTAKFSETTRYEVTFDSPDEIDPEDGDRWFEAMDKACPDWFRDGVAEVEDRELEELKREGLSDGVL